MACSLIVVQGQRKVSDQEALEYARISGVTFIRLQHIKGSSVVEFAQRGFQSVDIHVETDLQGGRHYKHDFSKNQFTGEDCMGQRQLVFQPERHTGLLTADLPDTPFNRSVLVSCYFNNAQWKIIDPILDEEIKRQAVEFQKSIVKKPSKEEIIESLSEREKRLEEEVQKLRQQLTMNAAAQEVIKEKAEVSSDDSIGALGLSKDEEKRLRKEARDEAYGELSAQIEALQSKKGRAWASSKEYRETISPVVEAKYQQKLEAKYAQHTGAGSDD